MGLGADVGCSDGARSDPDARRVRLLASGLIAFPMISGIVFGALSGALVLPIGGLGRAGAVGALVGGCIFATNAAALCIVESGARDAAAHRAEPPVQSVNEARAS